MPLKRFQSLVLSAMLGLGFLVISFVLLAATSPVLAREDDPVLLAQTRPAMPHAQGNLITVNTFADDNTVNGNCTLREAVIAANTNTSVDACPAGGSGQDTIILPAGVYFLTIPGSIEDAAATGDLDITESLLIRGAAADTTSVDGPAHGDRIFHVLTGSLTLQDMAVISGSVIQDIGGGILHESGDPLRLQNVHIFDNSADSGGGVAVTSGSLIITDTLIISNSAFIQGGGVLLNGTSATTYTQSGSSSVAFNSAATGGGIYAMNGVINLLGGDVSGNQALSEGGGLSVSAGVINLAGGNVLSNTATGDGGGVSLIGFSRGSLTGGVVGYNQADNGGGILTISSTFTISAGSVFSNSAQTFGGGMLQLEGVVTMAGGEIAGNSTGEGGGGGVMVLGIGGIDGRFTLAGGRIVSNTAPAGGGVLISFGGEFNQTGGIIGGNYATDAGGGLASLDSYGVNLSGGQIISNSVGVDGGGLYIFNNGSEIGLTLNGTDIISNTALTGSGGGMYVDISAAGGVTMHAGQISGNRAAVNGGGVFNRESFTLTGGQISHNIANSGGGLYFDSPSFFNDFSGGQIWNNTALGTAPGEGGGGLYFAGGGLYLSGVDISYNRASDAAGIAITGTAFLSQTGSVTITSNVAAQSAGGIGVAGSGEAFFNGARILYNRAGSDGGAFRQNGGTLVINASCVVNNDAPAGSYGGGVAPLDATGNWWGMFDGPGGAGPGSGDSVTANVDFANFLTFPPADCPYLVSPRLEVFESNEETRVAEGGTADDYTLQLTTPPIAPVRVTITTDGQVTVLPNVITFTAANWSTPQTAQVLAVDDSAPEYFHTGVITNSTSSSDLVYAGQVVSLTAFITDNDPAADLEVAKSAPPVAVQGSKFTYLITVTNRGPWPATNLVITDTLPAASAAGAQLASQPLGDSQIRFEPPTAAGDELSAAATVCLPTGNIFRCNVDSLAPGGRMLLNLEYTPGAGGLLVNRVDAAASEADPGQYPNSAVVGTAVGAVDVDLVLTKQASAASVQMGSPVTYSIVITNTGTDTAYGVEVLDMLPANFTVINAQSTQGSCENGDGTVTCGIGTVPPNTPEVVTISALPGAIANPPVVAVNSASVSVAVGTDTNPANNSDSAAVTVTGRQVNLSLNKVASTNTITVGHGLVYTVTVANAPTANPAVAVMLTDTLPAAVAPGPVSASSGSCSVAGQVVMCALGQLAPGAAHQVSLLVTPTVVASFTNVAAAADAYGLETFPADNSAQVIVTSVGIGAVASPGVTTTLEVTNPGGQVIQVLVPAGAVSQSIRLQLDPIPLPGSPPVGLGFAGIGFRLTAYSDPGNALLPGYVFSRPITITLTYRDEDVANIADENTLVLYYLGASGWADAATTCGAGYPPRRNPAINQITVAVCHLTEFALLGEVQTTPTYLPVILKGSP